MLRKFHRIAIPYGFIFAVAGCTNVSTNQAQTPTPTPTTTPSEVTVKIDNFTFTPANLSIPAGTKVTWINHDDVPHTATSTTNVFDSKALDTDEKFSFVFARAGTFPYYCEVHPHMTGQITVK